MSSSTASVGDGEDLARSESRPQSFAPLRWLRAKVAKAVAKVGAVATAAAHRVKSVLSRAVDSVREKVSSPLRLAKSVFMATIGKDRGFGFWWLVVTAAIALTIGLLVAVVLSPVVGIVAGLAVGIWMLIRRSRASQSRNQAAATATS